MSRKNSLIFIAVVIIFIPLLGFLIWTEFFGGESDFRSQLESNAPKVPSVSDASSNQSASASSASKNQTKIPPKEAPIKEPEPEEKKDPLEDWRSYKSSKDNFEFKYPPEATVNDEGSFVSVSQNDNIWKIKVYDNKKKEEVEAWFERYFEEKERENCVFSDSTLRLGENKARQAKSSSEEAVCEQDGYYGTNAEKTKTVKVKIGEETVENVNKILLTFKFN